MAEPTGAEERLLARGALRVLGLLAVPVAGIAGTVGGWPAMVSALIGLGFVLVLFGGSALLLAWAADRAPSTALGLLLAGVWGRLILYFAVLSALAPLSWVHQGSLAAAAGVAVAVTLAYELRLLARTPRLFWVDAEAGRPSAASNATRSQPL